MGTVRELTLDSTLSSIEQAQVIEAVRSSSYDGVSPLEEAFDAADGNEINQVELWDKTSATPYMVYEFGAGGG